MASYILEKDKLEGVYAQAFEQVEAYTILQNMENQESEEMLLNLIDSLYSAQTDGKSVEMIVGTDIETFCEEYFCEQTSPQSRRRDVFKWIYTIAWLVLIFGLLECLLYGAFEEGSVWDAPFDLSPILIGVGVGVAFKIFSHHAGKKALFRMKKVNATAVAFAILAVVIGVTLLATVFFEEYLGSVPLVLPTLPLLVVSALYIAGFKALELYERYKRTGTLKKPPKDGTFKEIFWESFETGYAKAQRERFEKKNARRLRRGKAPFGKEEYMDRLEREQKFVTWFLRIFYLLIWVAGIILVAMDSSFGDTCLFAAVMSAVLLPILLFFNKPGRRQQQIIADCRAKGITVLDLDAGKEGAANAEDGESAL